MEHFRALPAGAKGSFFKRQSFQAYALRQKLLSGSLEKTLHIYRKDVLRVRP